VATQRARKRQVQDTQARYDAAGMGRRIKNWNPPGTGPQRAVEGQARIRDRARDSTRNDWAGEAGVAKWTTTLVGFGVTPRWEDDRHTALWTAFVPQADADGVLDAYGLQTLMVRSWLASGEVFLRRRSRDLSLPLNVPLQVQLVESDYVPLFDADQWNGMPIGHTIRQGIELNKYGRRIAYWFYREHPGDKAGGARPGIGDLVRVLAQDVSHFFEPTRPGQLRGVSMLAPILVRLRASMDFEDAVLDRQKLANLFTMFITQAMPTSWADIEVDALTGLPKWYDDASRALVGLEPGISQQLRPGEDVKFANPPEAGTSMPDYMRTTHMGTAAGMGQPYELFSGDIRDVSDRTLRIAVNEYRRFAEQRQWQIVIPMGCRPIVRWLGEAAVLAGKLRPSEIEAFNAAEWTPHGWADIHPTQDIEGRIKARDAGFTSTSAIISRSGEDPKKVLKQRQADEASGLTPKEPEPAAAPPAGAQPPEPGTQALLAGMQALLIESRARPAPVAAQAGPSAVEQALGSLAALVASQASGLAATQTAVLALAQALAQRPIEIKNEVQPTPVEITNEVQPTPLTVVNENHVAAANVQVDVSPTPLTVVNENTTVVPENAISVDVSLPKRETTSDIERDQAGNIRKVTQTERTIN